MIKKYFLLITLIATCQVFSKGFYGNLENNLKTDVTQTLFGPPYVSTCTFFKIFIIDLINPFNQVRCNSFFSCFNHFSVQCNDLFPLEFIGSTTYLRKGIRA
jgi:hypothetical protein